MVYCLFTERVLKRLDVSLTDDEIEGLASARPGCIEELLRNFMIIVKDTPFSLVCVGMDFSLGCILFDNGC